MGDIFRECFPIFQTCSDLPRMHFTLPTIHFRDSTNVWTNSSFLLLHLSATNMIWIFDRPSVFKFKLFLSVNSKCVQEHFGTCYRPNKVVQKRRLTVFFNYRTRKTECVFEQYSIASLSPFHSQKICSDFINSTRQVCTKCISPYQWLSRNSSNYQIRSI